MKAMIFKMAWSMVKTMGMTMSAALRAAWKAIKVKVAMAKAVVKFTFRKKDGSERVAEGTTNLNTIPVEKHPKEGKASSPKVITFFDTIKQEWRSFKPEAIIAIG